MSETPAWLAAGKTESPAPAPSSSVEVTTLPTSSGTTPNPGNTTSVSDDDKELPGIILMMRLTNMGMAAGIIASAVSCIDLGGTSCGDPRVNNKLTVVCSFSILGTLSTPL